MCWISEPGKLLKEKISDGKIVYKCLIPKGLFRATSEVYSYTYVWRKLNEEKELIPILTYPEKGVYTISVGYHSWNEMNNPSFWWDYDRYYEMLIPKGAIYYENEKTGEIVSNQIKMMRRVLHPNTKITLLHRIGIILGFLRKYDS